MSTGLLILVSAPSGAGKTSLVEAALATDERLVVSISHTTRQQRANEQEGVNYFFTETAAFNDMVEQQAFLEHAVVFGNQYGTAQQQVQSLRDGGQDVILEIDWQGAQQITQIMPEALSIFVLPPTTQVLRNRLLARGQDTEQAISTRLAAAQLEMSQAHWYRYVVVNDDFDQALSDILAIIQSRRLQTDHQIRHNPQVKAILSAR